MDISQASKDGDKVRKGGKWGKGTFEDLRDNRSTVGTNEGTEKRRLHQ